MGGGRGGRHKGLGKCWGKELSGGWVAGVGHEEREQEESQVTLWFPSQVTERVQVPPGKARYPG